MDESRKSFEEWIKFQSDEDEMNGKLERANSGSNYADSTTDICWIAWQASRAAIEIELPDDFINERNKQIEEVFPLTICITCSLIY